jgi:hypothetical protein
VQSYDITLSLKGTPATLESTLTSNDPQLSESDMVSLLLVGRNVDRRRHTRRRRAGRVTHRQLSRSGGTRDRLRHGAG